MAKIIKIDSINVSELDAYVRMTEAQLKNKLCPENSIFIAESPTVIEVAIQGGCVPVSFWLMWITCGAPSGIMFRVIVWVIMMGLLYKYAIYKI